MKKKIFLLFLTAGLVLLSRPFSFAQQTPGEIVGGQERIREQQAEQESLRKKAEEKKEPAEIEEQLPQEPVLPPSQEKVMVRDIRVTDARLVPEAEINSITAGFEGRELTLPDMQKAADLITNAYRKKGYVTSRAYLPPQKIESGILEIRVLEGLMGDVEIKGNRYFSARLLRSKITLDKNEPFNYDILRKDLVRINRNPDRYARAVLLPGKEEAQTDVILEVKDRLPIHAGFDYDNFGSRYIGKDRYTGTLSHANLFGFDDNLSFQYQLAQHSRYYYKSVRYSGPVAPDANAGLYAAFSRVKLGEEFEDADVRGKSKLYGVFADKSLIDGERLSLTLNLGFDYKDITNYQLQTVSSTDRLRVLRTGLNMDLSDEWGRTIITQELDFGIPDIMGGLRRQDDKASRSGAGGKFNKNTVNLLRLQKLPLDATLLWKNQIQTSPYILTSIEQFQIGGISNVRGYPPAEAVGDSGYSTTAELTFPAYFIPKDVNVPFSRAKMYDALRFAMFYDWANARLRRPSATEEKDKTLRGAGWGVRFNLPENFSIRFDMAWPLDNTPSDSDHMHPWIQVSKGF